MDTVINPSQSHVLIPMGEYQRMIRIVEAWSTVDDDIAAREARLDDQRRDLELLKEHDEDRLRAEGVRHVVEYIERSVRTHGWLSYSWWGSAYGDDRPAREIVNELRRRVTLWAQVKQWWLNRKAQK